jgi:hypothetical protein
MWIQTASVSRMIIVRRSRILNKEILTEMGGVMSVTRVQSMRSMTVMEMDCAEAKITAQTFTMLRRLILTKMAWAMPVISVQLKRGVMQTETSSAMRLIIVRTIST